MKSFTVPVKTVKGLIRLQDLHNSHSHPGITRMMHFIRSRNLPYSLDDIKRMASTCNVCLELKPQFCQSKGHLIKATRPFERLNIDFKGPLPTVSRNKYLLTIIDEYRRFPFAFASADIESSTVLKCFNQLFLTHGSSEGRFVSQCHHVCRNCSSGLLPWRTNMQFEQCARAHQ